MAKYSLVLSDELQEEFYKFRNNEEFDQQLIERLLHYYKAPVLTNTAQLERIKAPSNRTLETALRKSGYTIQTLPELANKTIYKVVLCTDNNVYPYVNINEDKIENNLSGCFLKGESRLKAIEHIKALCSDADKILIYDKHFSKPPYADSNVKVLKQLLPMHKLAITYDKSHIDDNDIATLQSHCQAWTFEKEILPAHHDRYIEIDGSKEVIMTSGFSYLGNSDKEFTYIIRPVSLKRF